MTAYDSNLDDQLANTDDRSREERAAERIADDLKQISETLPGLSGQPLVADWMVEAGFAQSTPADAARMIRERLSRIESTLRIDLEL